ncbi:MAG: 3-isopropylmalate dehydrogenase [Thermomicrobiales bacterium]|nr:3-isopropylmalate dehydrogenase [Thermomicrobiales bacterium]MCO5226243.1 3-isopropylmalate dehydrogenase [Thermomicrobiales bacterium]MCO5227566.1 3-isopropylmalate dehydrogenase [Thermomicrobiales bacterium]
MTSGNVYNITLLPGDGVGPEVMTQATRVAEAAATKFGFSLNFDTRLIGGCAIDAYGTPLRDEDIEAARASDAVLLGSVGGPKWDNPSAAVRPEQGLLKIRKELGLFANLRPVTANEALLVASPIKENRLRGTDMLVVRELTGGIYFGDRKRWTDEQGRVAMDTLIYREYEVRRIVELAFELARGRKGRVTSVDKANVLDSSRMWREITTEIGAANPDITLEHMLVDAMTMKLIQQPGAYDVIVTENMFGDILTDEASVLGGSIGLLPSASLGAPAENGRRIGLYEPIHGSAPDIAGQGIANPAGMILSAAMMMRMSLNESEAAAAIEAAVDSAVNDGVHTGDLGGSASTSEFGDAVLTRV